MFTCCLYWIAVTKSPVALFWRFDLCGAMFTILFIGFAWFNLRVASRCVYVALWELWVVLVLCLCLTQWELSKLPRILHLPGYSYMLVCMDVLVFAYVVTAVVWLGYCLDITWIFHAYLVGYLYLANWCILAIWLFGLNCYLEACYLALRVVTFFFCLDITWNLRRSLAAVYILTVDWGCSLWGMPFGFGYYMAALDIIWQLKGVATELLFSSATPLYLAWILLLDYWLSFAMAITNGAVLGLVFIAVCFWLSTDLNWWIALGRALR